MSVDVFGRQLHPLKGIVRGPPGEGFRLTPEGHFDMENKRLCQVAHPLEFQDAVNLDYLQDVLQTETTAMQRKLANVRTDLMNMLANLKSELSEKLKNQRADLDMTHSLTLCHAELIYVLDVKVNGPHV